MKTRIGYVLAAALLTGSSLALAAGICGYVPNDCTTQQAWCSKIPPMAVDYPNGLKTWSACTTATVAVSDICTATPTAGGCPMAVDGGVTIDPGWIPSSFPQGSGSSGYAAIWTGGVDAGAPATTLSSSQQIFDNGVSIGLGTSSPVSVFNPNLPSNFNCRLDVVGSAIVNGLIRVRDPSDPTKRADYQSRSGATTLNSYDDLNSVYLPYNINGSTLEFIPGSLHNGGILFIDEAGNMYVGGTSSNNGLRIRGADTVNTLYQSIGNLGLTTQSGDINLGAGSGYVCIGSTNCTSPLAVNAGKTFQVDTLGDVIAANTLASKNCNVFVTGSGTGTATSTWTATTTQTSLGQYIILSNTCTNYLTSTGTQTITYQGTNGISFKANATATATATTTTGTTSVVIDGSGLMSTSCATSFNTNTGANVTASLTTNYVPKATASNVLANSTIYNETNGNIGVNTASPILGALHVVGGAETFTTFPAHSAGLGTINSTTGWSGDGFLFSQYANNGFGLVYAGSTAYFGKITNTAASVWMELNANGMQLYNNGVGNAHPFYTFQNDTGSGMYLMGAVGALGFSTGNTNRIAIDSSGNVCIGSTNCTTNLAVGSANNFTVDSNGILAASQNVIASKNCEVFVTGTGTNTAAWTATATSITLGQYAILSNTCTSAATVGAMPSPMPWVCPSGMTCAGKTDSTTSTSTATGTGTFYATAAIPISGTVTTTATAAHVLVLPNATKTVTGTATIAETDLGTATPTVGKIPIAGSDGDGKPSLNGWITGATGSGNTVSVAGGRVTGVSTTSYVPTTSVHVSYQQNVMLAADVSTTGGTWVALLNVNLAGYASTGDTINCWASTSGGGSTGIPRIRIRQVNNNVDGVTKAFHQTSGGGPSNLSGVYASKLYNTPVQLVMYLDYSAGDTGTFSISGASDADNSAALLCQVMANVP